MAKPGAISFSALPAMPRPVSAKLPPFLKKRFCGLSVPGKPEKPLAVIEMPLFVYVTVGGNAAFAVQPGLLAGQAAKLYEFAEAIGTNTAPASKPNSNRVFIDPPPALALRRYL